MSGWIMEWRNKSLIEKCLAEWTYRGLKRDLEKGVCIFQPGVGLDATPFRGRFGALSGFPWTLHSSYRSMRTPKRIR